MDEPTILIISCDTYWCRLIRHTLENASYRVLLADTGETGLKMVSKMKPNIVLLDWKLPDLSPLAITRAIRSDTLLQKLLIVLSGREMSSDEKLQSLEAGADFCLDEKIFPKELIARIRALLRRVNGPFQV